MAKDEEGGTNTVAPPGKKPEIVQFFESVQEGRLVDDMDAQLRELVLALQHQARNSGGKPKGKLKVEIDFKLEDGVLEVLARSTTTLPKPVTSRSIFYALPDGRVAENNPKQLGLDLPVRDVAAPAAASVRSIR